MLSKSIALNLWLAFLVTVLVATAVASWSVSKPWATLSEFHVQWHDGKLDLSVRLDKRRQCRRTLVNKLMRPIVENDIAPFLIGVNGSLSAKIQEARPGSEILFDLASPRLAVPVPPRQYLISMVALCETDDGQVALASNTVQTIMVIPADVPAIRPDSLLYP